MKRSWLDIHPKVVGALVVTIALLVIATVAGLVPSIAWAGDLLKAAVGAALASLGGYMRSGDESPR